MPRPSDPNPHFKLRDPRPIRAEAPYTFYIPKDSELEQLKTKDLVKLIFEAVPPSEQFGGERMWVHITSRRGDRFEGTLDNEPDDMPNVTAGDLVQFQTHHIISIKWYDKARDTFRFSDRHNDSYFEFCFVDNAILQGKARAQYIYRETPENSKDDKRIDSGWRIRAEIGELTWEENEDLSASFTIVGKVLNEDDSFIDILDAPIGSRYFRETGAKVFVPMEETHSYPPKKPAQLTFRNFMLSLFGRRC